MRVVQVWFQNQRAKMKKIQRKAKQDLDKSPSDKDEKRDKSIKQEPLSGDHSEYQGTDSRGWEFQHFKGSCVCKNNMLCLALGKILNTCITLVTTFSNQGVY